MVPNELREAGGSQSVFERGSRSRCALELIADKWAVLIVYALSRGIMRHNQLHREIEGISQKMPTKTLRRLERDGVIGREVYPVVPPRVEYSLTPLGETLISILAELCAWAEEHIEEVEAARRDYDARQGS
ncbi:MAG: helix-turn-helix transcriptional regulator [Actinomycetota bacterium]|jgi:DNA-binding HxlR family transcriptional regulator|nr:helix-turn-helix transcriptional regulator [Actinomycetota bacterium]